MIKIDADLGQPIYTPESAKKAGLTDEEITKIFGKSSEKGMLALQTVARSIAEIIHHAKRG